MIIGVCKETFPGERRVALIPDVVRRLTKLGLDVLVECGSGLSSGFSDESYIEAGARTAATREEVFGSADLVLQVRCVGSNPEFGRSDIALMRGGQCVIGFTDPLTEFDVAKEVAGSGATLLAMELLPRITRAQSMDALSSMATVAGYKAVLLAADHLPKMFPMLMTAAGTVKAAKVLVVGAGVAGLQAIATAKRLGAVVRGYDIRSAVKEQIESLGAKFVEMELETGGAEGSGGYARAMDEDFYKKQRELLHGAVAESDVVITTAAVPGKKAPVLITKDMVKDMAAGSVIVDVAAERGGNCALTKVGETVVEHDVTIVGATNLPTSAPTHASQMYAKNLQTLLEHLIKDGALVLDMEDEITREMLITRDGEVVQPRVRELLGLPNEAEETEEVAANG